MLLLQCNCISKSICKPVSFSSWHAQNLDYDAFVHSPFYRSNCIHFRREYNPNHGDVSAMPHPLCPKLTRGCQQSIPGMKNDVTFSCCGHINHTITISSSLDTNLDSSLLPLPNSLRSCVTVFPLLLHFLSLPLSLPAQRMPLVTAPISAF